jgi:hypothetical protein
MEGHTEEYCWRKHPEKRPASLAQRLSKKLEAFFMRMRKVTFISTRYLERGGQEKKEVEGILYDEQSSRLRFSNFENEVYDETREKESKGFFDLS